ncbi:MAG TPA: HIT family protein, partial [Candidatus Yonathbacteria bacterium]|nr:HIT family protein [Candidatus Yonathbacteria bacterium]
ASYLIVVVKKLSNAVLKAVGAGGINILSNNKAPAGQIIEHPHIHIVPRFSDDNLSEWQSHKYKVGEKEKYVEKIKSSII